MPETEYFKYEKEEITYLKTRDPVLGAAMDEIGHIRREVIPDLFAALVHSIVSQQISSKAQTTIWTRIMERYRPLTPKILSAVAPEELQTCGITLRKAFYIKDIADAVLSGGLNLDELSEMKDEEVCKHLCQIKGIGLWTAEMLMIFSMQRKDIFSYGDLAIHRGLRMLYRHRKITPALFNKYKKRYSPYATVASLYLWAIAGGACPELADPSKKGSK